MAGTAKIYAEAELVYLDKLYPDFRIDVCRLNRNAYSDEINPFILFIF